MKPQLAEDAIIDAVRFPCIVQPKIDGVRALNLNGTLTGRSLKPFEGFGITEYFSKPDAGQQAQLHRSPVQQHHRCYGPVQRRDRDGQPALACV
jgi:hypothetical protein